MQDPTTLGYVVAGTKYVILFRGATKHFSKLQHFEVYLCPISQSLNNLIQIKKVIKLNKY
jgi:hypothetical protein